MQSRLQRSRAAGCMPAPAGACEARGACALSPSCAQARLCPVDPHSIVRTAACRLIGIWSIALKDRLLGSLYHSIVCVVVRHLLQSH